MVCNRVTDSPVNHLNAAMGGRAQPSRSSFPRGMALLVAGAFFMEILDATIIAPAIPRVPQRLADHRSAHPIAFGQGSLGSFTPIGSSPLSIAENRSSNTDPRRSAASSPRQPCAPSPSVARCGLGVAPRKSDKPSRNEQQAGTNSAGLPLTTSTVE